MISSREQQNVPESEVMAPAAKIIAPPPMASSRGYGQRPGFSSESMFILLEIKVKRQMKQELSLENKTRSDQILYINGLLFLFLEIIIQYCQLHQLPLHHLSFNMLHLYWKQNVQ